MTFSQAVAMSFAKYATFSGRARRSEYWWFSLAQALALFVSYGIAFIVPIGLLLAAIVLLGTFIPHLSMSIRRLHDTNRSAWWYLLIFVPIGGLLLLIWFCLDGTSGPNRYGEDPKAVAYIAAST
jgi:uncharacterized membrane protein YhaH (DUF805 family)